MAATGAPCRIRTGCRPNRNRRQASAAGRSWSVLGYVDGSGEGCRAGRGVDTELLYDAANRSAALGHLDSGGAGWAARFPGEATSRWTMLSPVLALGAHRIRWAIGVLSGEALRRGVLIRLVVAAPRPLRCWWEPVGRSTRSPRHGRLRRRQAVLGRRGIGARRSRRTRPPLCATAYRPGGSRTRTRPPPVRAARRASPRQPVPSG